MEQPHKNEIHRLADAEAGTHVWLRSKDNNQWYLDKALAWLDTYHYIVDDEWAEIRKFFIDNNFIWFLRGREWVRIHSLDLTLDMSLYSIGKPDVVEETFYYQYEKLHAGRIDDTCHVSEDRANRSNYTEANGWFKVESSKRKWEH